MHLRTILGNLFARNLRKTNRRPAQMRERVCPALEALEDRVTPTVFFTPQNGAENATNPGGPVVNTSPGMPIYTVFWGSYWATSAGQAYASNIENSLNSMFYFSPYLNGLHQYGVQNPAYVGTSGTQEVFNYSDPAANFTDNDVFNTAVNAIQNQGINRPGQFSNDGVYFVITAPGAQFNDPQTGGYHTFGTENGHQFNYGWIGTNGSLDSATYILSHEVVETMTDPHGNAWQVDPRSSSAWNEISDNEAQNYTYRLNGYEVQSYWSQANGAYMVSDGNTQAVTVNNGVLTVNGDQLGANYSDTISVSTNSRGGVQVNENGEVFSFDAGQITSINVNTGGGNDTVNVLSEAWGVPLNIRGGGHDTINLGSNGSVQGIRGTVNIQNPPSFNTINVDASNDPARNVTLSTFTGSDGASWGKINGLAPFADINYKYADTSSITVNTGAAGTTVNVLGTGVTTNVIGHASTTVNVGNGGSVTGIWGTLNLSNPPSFNAVTVNDSADTTARTATLSTFTGSDGASWGSITGLGSAPINYKYADTSSITVHTGVAFGTVVNVQATGVTTNVIGHGSTTVNVGSGGSVQGIRGTLNLSNPPSFNAVTVDDSADTTIRTVTLGTFTGADGASWGYLAGLAPANINYKYADTSSITVDTPAASGNTINVLDTGVTTTLVGAATGTSTVNVKGTHRSLYVNNGGGFNAVYVGSNGSAFGGTVQSILGSVSAFGSGQTWLYIDDSGDSTRRTATLNNGSLTGLAPAAIYWTPSSSSLGGVDYLDLLGGRGGNTFNVADTSNFFYWTDLHSGAGNDTINVNRSTGALHLDGGLGNDLYHFAADNPLGSETLTDAGGNDTISFAGTNAGVILNLGLTTQQTVNANLKLTLAAGNMIENLTGGNGNDKLTGNSLKNIIRGGAGNDTLVGGSGGGVLLGGAGSNTLIGGAGRSILITGSGASTATGGAKGDIVIGGTTSYDFDNVALDALLAEWQRTDLTYSQRVSALQSGVVDANGHIDRLVWGTTVFDNGAANTLRGQPAGTAEPGGNERDWFFANLAAGHDLLPDRIGSEFVN